MEDHPADRDVVWLVVADLQAECLEQPPERRLGDLGELDRGDREQVQQLLGRSGVVRLDVLGGVEFGELGPLLGVQLAQALLDAGEHRAVGVVAHLEGVDQPGLARLELAHRAHERVDAGLVVLLGLLVGAADGGGEQLAAVGAKDAPGEELADALEEGLLADPQALGVVAGVVLGPGALAGVVGDPAAGLAEHAPPAQGADHERAEQVGALGVGVGGVGAWGGAGAEPFPGDGSRGVEQFLADQRLVGRLWGAHPCGGLVDLALGALGRAPVPDHVAGVLRVAEDVADGGGDPVVALPGRVGGDRRRVAVGVGVEPVGDRLVAQALGDAPGEDLPHDRRGGGVGDQAVLGLALGAAGWYRVGDRFGAVAVGWAANVPALAGVLAEAVPGLLLGFERVPLRGGLLDSAGEDAGGLLAADLDRLVGGQQRHAGLFEFVLDQRAVVGAPGDAVDRLADDRVEAAVGPAGLGEQVGDAAVAADRDVEQLVGAGLAAQRGVEAAAFDVVVGPTLGSVSPAAM